jgi:hypothetical protein
MLHEIRRAQYRSFWPGCVDGDAAIPLLSPRNKKKGASTPGNHNMEIRISVCGVFLCALLASCGGGGGGGESGPPPVPAPSALSYSSPQNLRMSSAMTPLTPGVTGSVTSYAISPALPAGLTFDTVTGRISGTPTVASPPTSYTITAANASGSTSFVLSLKVFTVALETSRLTRMSAEGASIYPTIIVRPLHIDVATLHANAQDSSGIVLPAVEVSARGDGSFALQLTTNPSVSPNLFTGDVTLNLCRDSNCATPLEVPSVTVPFSIHVLGAQSAWPGDHLTTLSAWNGVPDWSTFQGNASHTGFVRVTVDPDEFTTRWKGTGYPVWNGWSQLKANLVTADGLFYVVSSNYLDSGVLHARRESDNSEVWHYPFDGMTYPSANPAAVNDGIVYVAAGHQTETDMFAFNAIDGSVVYRSRMSSQWEGYLAPTIGPNGMLYANAGTYGGMYAFNPIGNQLFFAFEAQTSNWTPAVDAAGAYAYTGGRLTVHDLLTGAVLNEINDPSFQNYVYEIGGSPVLGAPGSVFVANYQNSALNGGAIGNMLLNFRTATNSIAWQEPGAYPTTPGYKSEVVYAVNNIPFRLEARAESDGTLLWWWTPPHPGDGQFISEVLLTENLAFVSTNRATYAIDLETHRPVFSYPVFGKLALSANGVLYIQNATDLIAINLK